MAAERWAPDRVPPLAIGAAGKSDIAYEATAASDPLGRAPTTAMSPSHIVSERPSPVVTAEGAFSGWASFMVAGRSLGVCFRSPRPLRQTEALIYPNPDATRSPTAIFRRLSSPALPSSS